MFNLLGSVALVTGSGRGNGRAIARGLFEHGAVVYGVDREFPCSDPFQQILGDVASPETIRHVVDLLTSISFHSLILINNAGVTYPCEGRYPEELWRKTLEINLTTPFLWIEALSDIFQKTGSGRIINITSLATERAFPNNPSYAASKGGLKTLGKYYAKKLAKWGVCVNNVAPGYMQTNMTKKSYENMESRLHKERHTLLGRWGKPEDLVGICVFLSSSMASYITGQNICVDGGWTANGLIE